MDDVCRLCLRLEENMTSIFCGDEKPTLLQMQIKDYCFVEVSAEDALPKLICEECKGKLNAAQEFREKSRQSDSMLREYYKVADLSVKLFQDVSVQTEVKTDNDSSSTKQTFSSRMKKERLGEARPIFVQTDANNSDDGVPVKKESNCIFNKVIRDDDCNGDNCDSGDDYKIDQNRLNPEMDRTIQDTAEIPCKNRRRQKQTKEKEKFVCHMCQKVYVSKKALLKHTEAHMNEEIFTCEVCNKTFNNRDKLADHGKKHNDSMDFKCEVCGMPFREQVKLNFHLRVHGRGPPMKTEKQYLCDVCSKTFASKSGLRFHLKSHTGAKPYKCKYCNKGFTIPSYKKRHERTHTGDKHFICHICSAAFASANGLKYHLRAHTGEANYHCETCGKSFRRFKYLKEHTFTHTGERPFACKICGSAYGNSGSLFVHEKKCKTQYALSIINAAKTAAATDIEHT